MQYTLEDVPESIDRALRERAATEHKNPEQVIIDTLAHNFGVGPSCTKRRDLSDIAGSWEVDPETEAALEEQGHVSPGMETPIKKRRDLSDIAGKRLITPEMKVVFEEQRRIDPNLWK